MNLIQEVIPNSRCGFCEFFLFLLIELPEKQEQLHAIYKVLEELPPANFNTLERLVFHLVKYLSPSYSYWCKNSPQIFVNEDKTELVL